MTSPSRISKFLEPGPVRVKICGLTNRSDALAACEAGADAIGINFFEGSKRFIPFDDAASWIGEISCARIAVVVNASDHLIQRICESGQFDAIQFHGDESPLDCARSTISWIRAIRVQSDADLQSALEYQTPFLLLDAFSTSEYGGTGHQIDWCRAEEFIAGHPDRKIFLAGGLTPKNVAGAVSAARPFAVDTASGVEVPGNPRRKDRNAMIEFVSAVRSVGVLS